MMKKLLLAVPVLMGLLSSSAEAQYSLPGSRPPTGPAGGVLSGTFPNPGFANMTSNAFLTGNGTGLPNAVPLTGLVIGNGASAPTAYAGVTCTNQFLRALSAAGASTCNTVGSSDLAASLSLVTPNINVATGTSLALNGATLGTNVAAITGTVAISGITGIGPGTAAYLLTVNANTVSLPASTLAGTVMQIGGADATGARLLIDGFGGTPSLTYRYANGTAASPTAVTVDQSLGQFVWIGRGSTVYSSAARAIIKAVSAEAWTDTAQGTYITFSTTPKTTVLAVAERMRIQDSGNVSIGLTADNGFVLEVAGTSRITGAVTMNGLPTSAGAGGINVCVDSSGAIYKKATCP